MKKVVVKNECKDCQHKEICRNREDYEALIRKLSETKAEYEWLTIDYSCDYYKKEECFGHPVADENGNLDVHQVQTHCISEKEYKILRKYEEYLGKNINGKT